MSRNSWTCRTADEDTTQPELSCEAEGTDGEISLFGVDPFTITLGHYVELNPDTYGHTFMQIGGWLSPQTTHGVPVGTQRMIYAHLHGRVVPRDVNVQVSVKDYGAQRRFVRIQWRKPAPVTNHSNGIRP